MVSRRQEKLPSSNLEKGRFETAQAEEFHDCRKPEKIELTIPIPEKDMPEKREKHGLNSLKLEKTRNEFYSQKNLKSPGPAHETPAGAETENFDS